MSQSDGHRRSIHSALRVVYLWHSNVRLRLCNILNTRDPSVREQEWYIDKSRDWGRIWI
jgi:hypothetical protein